MSSWQRFLQEAADIRINCKVFAAFNSNVDAIVHLDPGKLAHVLEGDLQPGHPIDLESERKVSTAGEFIAVLRSCLERGKSFYAVMDVQLSAWFENMFPEHSASMGGQAGIIANQMVALGARACVYTPLLSPQQASYFDQRVLFPYITKGRLQWCRIRSMAKDTETKINWIFEYKKGQKYRFNGDTVITPRANRIILGTRSSKSRMCFAPEMDRFLPDIGRSVDVAFMAGYHHGKAPGRAESLDDYIELSLKELRLLRENNPDLRIHVEYVPLKAAGSEVELLRRLACQMDSFGINENEIRKLLVEFGYDDIAADIAKDERAYALYRGLVALQNELGISRIQLHNLGYYVVVLNSPYPVPAPLVRNSCLLASAVNAIKARYGGVVKREQVEEGIRMPLSDRGRKQLHDFASEASKDGLPVESDFGETGIMEAGEHIAIVVPAHVVPNPVSTVGMGDTISATSYAAEVSSWLSRKMASAG